MSALTAAVAPRAAGLVAATFVLLALAAVLVAPGSTAVVVAVTLTAGAACAAVSARNDEPAGPVLAGTVAIVAGTVVLAGLTAQPLLRAVHVLVAAVVYLLGRQMGRRLDGVGPVGVALATVMLLVAPLLIGVAVNGSTAWLPLPGGVRIPAGEPARVVALLLLVVVVDRAVVDLTVAHGAATRRSILAVAAVPVGFLAVGIVTRDLAPALLTAAATVTVLVVATGRRLYPATAAASLVAAGSYAATRVGHVAHRLAGWADPLTDAGEPITHTARAALALARAPIGGIGSQDARIASLPAADSDMLVASAAEQFGVGGALLLIAAIVAVTLTLFRVANASSDRARLTAVAVATVLATQTALAIGSATGALPVIGLGVPLASAGGTSMACAMFLLGVVAGAAASPMPGDPLMTHRARIVAAVALLTVGITTVTVPLGATVRHGWANSPAIPDVRRAGIAALPTLTSSDGHILADSFGTGHNPRRYHYGDLYTATVGWVHPDLTGYGLDAQLATTTAQDDNMSPVTTTLIHDLQVSVARLAGDNAAVTVIDADSGAILARVVPTDVEAQQLFSGDTRPPADAPDVRPHVGPPGSSFKPVVTAAALGAGLPWPAAEDHWVVDGTAHSIANHSRCGDTPESSLAVSCNSVFARLAAELDPATLTSIAEQLYGLPLYAHPDVTVAVDDSVLHRALAGIGQHNLRVTADQAAHLAATVASGGIAHRLTLTGPDGDGVRVIDADIAARIGEGMRRAVESGTARRAAIDDGVIAAKTGTATVPGGNNDAWCLGYVTAGTRSLAIAVHIPGAHSTASPSGPGTAAPLFSQVATAALAHST